MDETFIFFINRHLSTFWQGYSVSLAIQEASQLFEVTFPLHVILDSGGLHKEGVEAVLLPHPVNARAVAGRVHARLG